MMFTSAGGSVGNGTTVGANGPRTPEFDTLFVTPSDAVDLPTGGGNGRTCVGLQVTGAGNVNVNLTGGGTAVLTGLSANQRVNVPVTRILSTSTTATGILAFYAGM